MTGVPAKQKGWVSRNGIVLGEDLICPETGEKYKLVNDNLILENEQ
jgi:UDP-2-acetamido-3-amino-2,3-dideoxy-glucuronate N-acetyltransferase